MIIQVWKYGSMEVWKYGSLEVLTHKVNERIEKQKYGF